MTTDRPIIFSAPMVLAILSGRKTVTRRIVKPQPDVGGIQGSVQSEARSESAGNVSSRNLKRMPWVVGSRLWVREAWGTFDDGLDDNEDSRAICYRSTETAQWRDMPHAKEKRANGMEAMYIAPLKWRPSIFMPRWASRITLEVIDVRVERLHSIRCFDIRAEGFDCPEHDFPGGMCVGECLSLLAAFAELWVKINGPGSWDQNPFVWRVEFKRITDAAERYRSD